MRDFRGIKTKIADEDLDLPDLPEEFLPASQGPDPSKTLIEVVILLIALACLMLYSSLK